MSQPAVSVIVPAHNASDTVAEAIMSVQTSTEVRIQLIIVDDGSTDDTWDIIQQCVRGRQATEAIHLPIQGGVHNARHEGLKRASGSHVAFLDADDWLDGNFHDAIGRELSCADIIAFGMWSAEGPDQARMSPRVAFSDRRLHTGDVLRAFADWTFQSGSLCNKVFRREMLDSDRIWNLPAPITINEDYLVNLHAFSKAQRVLTIPDMLYYARERRGSATRSPGKADLFAESLRTCATGFEVFASDDRLTEATSRLFLRVLSSNQFTGALIAEFPQHTASILDSLGRILAMRPAFLYEAFQGQIAPSATDDRPAGNRIDRAQSSPDAPWRGPLTHRLRGVRRTVASLRKRLFTASRPKER